MPNYGIRFYKVELFLGNKRKPLVFQDENNGTTWRYRDHLAEVLKRYKDTQVRGFPRSQDASETAEDIRRKTAVVLNEVQSLGEAGLRGEYRVGRSDDFDRAYPAPDMATTDYVELAGYSPARPYRVALLLPETGNVGILAVEAIGRTCPHDFFTKWATKWSRDYQAVLDAKEPLADGAVRPWWRLHPTPLGSRDQLNRFLKGGSVDELVLINHFFDKQRNERYERFRVKAKVGSTERIWAKKSVDDVFDIESDETFARQLAKSFGNTVDQLDVDDGYLVVKTDAGVKKISPSRLPEVFTYPVSEARPTLEAFLAAVKTEAIPLARAIDAKVDFESW